MIEGSNVTNVNNELTAYVSNLNNLNSMQKAKVEKFLYNFRFIFSDEPGCTNIYHHSIKPIVENPFVRKSYPIPLKLRPAVDQEINNMLKSGIIKRLDSNFCNPLRIVQKRMAPSVYVSMRVFSIRL